MNYYRRYIGDYGRDTSLLSLVEHGAYCVLLDHYYAAEAPLPADREDIYRLARAVKPEERKAVDKVLGQYFEEQATGFHNSRADSELERAAPAIKAARDNGRKGGRPANRLGSGGGTYRDTGSGTQEEAQWDTRDKPTGKAIRAGDPSPNHQPPEPSPNRHPPTAIPQTENQRQGQKPSPGASRSVARKRGNGHDQSPKTAPTWEAYAAAYLTRYGTEPVRNATVNAQLAGVVKRLGKEAPLVAAFYVLSNRGLYVSAKHAANLLLRDCEGLRTEWATGRQGTDTEARQADRTAATGNVFERLIEEADS